MSAAKPAIVEEVSVNQATGSGDGRLQAIRKTPVATLCCVGMLSILAFGLSGNQLNGTVLSSPRLKQYFGGLYTGKTGYAIETNWPPSLNGVPVLSGVVGQYLGSYVVSKVSRKSLYFVHLLFSVGLILLDLAARDYQMFRGAQSLGVITSILQGFGVTFVAENTPAHHRSKVITILNVAFFMGPLIGLVINSGSLVGKPWRIDFPATVCLQSIILYFFLLPDEQDSKS